MIEYVQAAQTDNKIHELIEKLDEMIDRFDQIKPANTHSSYNELRLKILVALFYGYYEAKLIAT